MAHKLGCGVPHPHGLANALLDQATSSATTPNDNPTKQTAFLQYDRPQARRRYAEVAPPASGLSHYQVTVPPPIEKLLTWLDG
ncbi:hypothetical protein ACNKHQ_07220 [Shigella flexneri]